jgi:hypothetical protein
MITLDQETHTYTDSSGKEYQSVTRFINKFVPQFNFDQQSQRYAAKYGMEVEDVRKDWKLKNKYWLGNHTLDDGYYNKDEIKK